MLGPKPRMLVFIGVMAGLLGSCNRPKPYETFKLKNGRTVVACKDQIGTTCVLGLQFLRDIDQKTNDPIYFDRSYTIIYSADKKGGQFEFQPFQHIDCSNEQHVFPQNTPPQHNDQPFKTLPSPGNPTSTIDPSQFDADDGQCYKHVIKGKNGEQDVDPHIIIGSGS